MRVSQQCPRQRGGEHEGESVGQGGGVEQAGVCWSLRQAYLWAFLGGHRRWMANAFSTKELAAQGKGSVIAVS